MGFSSTLYIPEPNLFPATVVKMITDEFSTVKYMHYAPIIHYNDNDKQAA